MNLLCRLTRHPQCLVRKRSLHYIEFTFHRLTVSSGRSYVAINQSPTRESLRGIEKRIFINERARFSPHHRTISRDYLVSARSEKSPLASNMTNKPRHLSSSTKSCSATNDGRVKADPLGQACTNHDPIKNLPNANGHHPSQTQSFNLIDNVNFKTMASVQKLAIEPTREHIENIRQILKYRNAKDNDDQEVTLEKDQESGIGVIRIKSAAKNGISAKMMCDFLDIIDQLYSWPQGKGVLIYGHNGFFCSGRFHRNST
jgi:hypothetical protein